jgi:nucleoside-diphosphate-sugar epimerase
MHPDLDSRKVLVNGASGFLGSYFRTNSFSVGVAVSRLPCKVRSGWNWVERSLALAERMADVDAVIHLEVKQHVFAPAAHDIVQFEEVNVGGVKHWLEWCERNAVPRFIYFSSIKAVTPSMGLTLETAPAATSSPYGISKWRAEQLVANWALADPKRAAIIVRPAVVYGARQVGNVGAMVAAIAKGRFVLVGRNENVKSIVSVDNLIAATAHLLRKMEPGRCEIYNIVDRDSYTVREIDMIIRAQLGKSTNSPTMPLFAARAAAKIGDVWHTLTGYTLPLNSQRLEALLEQTHFSCEKLVATGFVHPETTVDGLRKMVEWFRGCV